MGSEWESSSFLQPGRWKRKSDKETTRKKKKRDWNQSKTRSFKTPEMQDTGGEKPKTPTCYNWLLWTMKDENIISTHFPGFQSLLEKHVGTVDLKNRNNFLCAPQVSAILQMNYLLLHKKPPRPPLVLKAFLSKIVELSVCLQPTVI